MKQISDFSKEEIQTARGTVADWWEANVQSIRKKDPYASHVTESEKDELLRKGLEFSKQIREGKQDRCFTVAQRIHFVLTGESPALLGSMQQ